MKFLLGCDPELFVKQGDAFKTAHGLIPGTKIEPYKVPYGAVQVDGSALEFNIDPASSLEEWNRNISTVLTSLKSMVPNHQMVLSPVAHFDKTYFDTEVPEEAKELGCDPDYNAYTGLENPRPEGDRPFRTASGHIHIGWTEDADPFDPVHLSDCHTVVKKLDMYLGIPSLTFDRDNTRRQLYGKAGAFRPKSYGVEYRVLSNAWLTSQGLTSWVYNQTIYAMTDLMENYGKQEKFSEENVRAYIDSGKSPFGDDEFIPADTWRYYFGTKAPTLPRERAKKAA